jgi:hypothetical protein
VYKRQYWDVPLDDLINSQTWNLVSFIK